MRNYLFLICFFLLTSCINKSAKKIAKGDVVYGGELILMSTNIISQLTPYNAASKEERCINHQVFENLLTFSDKSGEVQPLLVNSWKSNENETVFRLTIQDAVYFHPDPCFKTINERLFTSEDLKFSIEMACAGFNNSSFSQLLANTIQGGLKFKKETKSTIGNTRLEGLSVIDAKTVEIKLMHSFPFFEKLLCHTDLVGLSHKAYLTYGLDIVNHPIGTGAFRLKDWNKKGITLVNFEEYWKKDNFGNRLPYLDEISWKFNVSIDDQIKAFKAGDCDLILDLEADEMEQIVGTLKEAQAGKNIKHHIVSTKGLGISFLTLNHQIKPFDNLMVRRAILMGINRSGIVDKCLKGSGELLTNGFLPTMYNFDGEATLLIPTDILQAQQHLATAQFENGLHFPMVELAADQMDKVSKEFLTQLKYELKQNLNIDAKIITNNYSSTDRIMTPRITLRSITASFPDPLSYLHYFYGKDNYRGLMDFKINNALFDKHLALSMQAKDPIQRIDYYNLCDQLLVDEAFVVPLYNHDVISVINARVRNYSVDNFERVDLASVYLR